MMTSGSGSSLERLSRPHGESSRSSPAGGAVPRPKSRWIMRFVLPLTILAAAVALLAYAARDALRPAVEVELVPVILKDAPANDASSKSDGSAGGSEPSGTRSQPQAEPTIIAQAPGWVEPDPYAVTVQSLISGVVEEVYVLEGDRVERGQIIARLIDEDARLAVRRAEAELSELEAAVVRARADLAAAESRLAELDDEVERKRELVEVGGVSPGEFARLVHRRRSQQSEVESARASLREHEAAVERQRVAIDMAELTLERTVIRAPVDGVVLSRSVVPGTRLAGAGDGPGEQHLPGVARLYNPEQLQVRADVPLSDAGKVGLGTRARIATEAAPDRTFHGEVTRVIHAADIQRNTVKMKVRIEDPDPVLKPDMLVRVRFLRAVDGRVAEANGESRSTDRALRVGSLRLYIPEHALIDRDGERGAVWVAEPDHGGRGRRAVRREVTLGERDGKLVRVRDGLRPGDRLIVHAPAGLTTGTRITNAKSNRVEEMAQLP